MTTNHSELLSNIPPELREPARWLHYYLKKNPKHPENKPGKSPCMKWGTPEDREANLRPLDSILDRDCPGFQRWIDPAEQLIYIDLDHVRKTDTGEVEPWAKAIIDQFDTYTEISASGTGFHIVCKGNLPEDFVLAGNQTEIYSGHINKLMALTGNIVGDFPKPIEDRQAQAEQLLKSVKSKSEPTAAPVSTDWRKHFRSPAELQTGEVRTLIHRILPEGTTVIGASAGVGKTWFGLSMAKALATGEKFLGTFEVPERFKVLYLIPEQGDRSLRTRMDRLRMPMDGESIRVRTQRDGVLLLTDPLLIAAVKEWHPVIFLDTAIRFTAAVDENSSSQNQNGLFAAICGLMQMGATAVVCNHHISKRFAQNDKGKLPLAELENLRGTSDLGAMVDTCWMLQPDDGGGQEGYLQESRDLTRLLVTNVKPRDLADPAEPFVIQGRPHIDTVGDFCILVDGDFAQSSEVDDIGLKAAELVRADPKMSKVALSKALGCSRNRLQEHLLSHGWEWKGTSRRQGLWVSVLQPTAPEFSAPEHTY